MDSCVPHAVCHVPSLWQAMQDVRGDDLREAGHVRERALRPAAVPSKVAQSIGMLAAMKHVCLEVCVPDKLEQRSGSMKRSAMCFVSCKRAEAWYVLRPRGPLPPQGSRGWHRERRAP